MQGYSLVCSFGAANLASAPYSIENACSHYAIAIRQKENSSEWTRCKGYFCLMPGRGPQPFAWDELLMPHRLAVVVLPAGKVHAYSRASKRPASCSARTSLHPGLRACGPRAIYLTTN
jgi:hypothetical protein